MIPRFASSLWWNRSFRRHARSWDELETFPRLPAQEQQHELARRLLAQIRYFGNREDALPEWREAARIEDPQELWRVWPSLPVVTKKDLQSRFQPAEMRERFGLVGRLDSTGGSTGEPTPFFHDTAMLRASAAASNYTRVRMGWRPGMATIIVWGSERDIGKQTSLRNRLNNRLFRDHLVDGYHLNRSTVERVAAIIRSDGPVAIYGFTSMLDYVARETITAGLVPPAGSVATAWNGGEMLFADQNEAFRQAFGTSILNRYGGRELSVMACEFEPGGPLNVLRPWLFVEVAGEDGRPVGPGQSGRLLWTSTVCRGTPLLRYDIGDLGAFDACHLDESGVSALAELHGRVASLLVLPDGRRVNNIYWNHLFKEFREVRQFQVILKRDRTLEILLSGAGFSPESEARVRSVLAGFLGEIPVRLAWVDTIPLTPQGKLVQVVREPASRP
jgi:phenylacetate-CoA ligase